MILLAEGARGEEFADEVEGAAIRINPGGVELHDGGVVEVLEEVNLGVEPLQLHWRVEHVIELHLVPCHLHPRHLVERLVHRLHRSFPQNFPELQSPSIHHNGVYRCHISVDDPTTSMSKFYMN